MTLPHNISVINMLPAAQPEEPWEWVLLAGLGVDIDDLWHDLLK
ncbi:hypothetical protein AB8989_17530 [Yersinia hibernica]|nr:hypothetical protein [Yersinia hibernica]